MPLFILIALGFAVICTAGLALPLVVVVIIAVMTRRPRATEDHLAIATMPGSRCTPVDVAAQ